jgi:ABC-type antimicrobial peptide transport system permease subunit
MNRRLLLRRSLSFNLRNHIGVILGAAVAAAVLVGALAVGDSVKETLKQRALDRIGGVVALLDGRDRFFEVRPGGLAGTNFDASIPAAHALRLPAVATRQDGAARANQVVLYGVPPEFWSLASRPGSKAPGDDEVFLNQALAAQLSAKPGDELVLRIHKPSALSQDAVITPRDGSSVALRVRVGQIVGPEDFGDVAFAASQTVPFNAFVPYERLAAAAALAGRANLSLLGGQTSPSDISARVERQFGIGDAELELRAGPGTATSQFVEMISRRIFIDPSSAKAALVSSAAGKGVPILTYLANGIGTENRAAPYSMVTAAGAPYTPPDMADDEIILNQWLADDLGVKPGDPISLVYYRVDAGAKPVEHTNTFRFRSAVSMEGVHADRTLMPEFPGLAKAESTQDWDAGFELTRQIRDKDEAYWKKWRGTPKAFVTLAAGRKMWANRFGDTTSVRWFADGGKTADSLREALSADIKSKINPADVGLQFQPLRDMALKGASTGQAQEFGGLFIGFSFFLIVSAVLLTALMFRFGIERRATEIGTLLALGWTPKRAGRLYLREGVALAAWGAVPGVFGGVLYGRGVIYALNTIWSDAVAGAELRFHAGTGSIIGGFLGAVAVAGFAQWLTLRGAMRRPARELLNEGVSESSDPGKPAGKGWVAILLIALGVGCAAAGLGLQPADQPGAFFGAGFLSLAGALVWLRNRYRSAGRRAMTEFTFPALTRRAPARQPGRSTAVIALLSIAVFLIVAVAANRLDASRDANARSSGTGGFALWASSSLPVVEDLDTAKGREKLGLDSKRLDGVSVVPMRVRDGDEASCLNLNYAQRPRLLGVDPAPLTERGAFTFKAIAPGVDPKAPWSALPAHASAAPDAVPEIPAIGDANSIQWALKKKIGDTLDYVDERGRPFRVRLVGAVANSILQGQLIISENNFTRLFPGETGYRMFLVDASGDSKSAAVELTRGLADFGFETTPAADRLNRFNAVQNTYLNTFQILGGLGLLLGSVGLGLVVLRNVFERRGELGVMSAVGYSPGRLQSMILREHLRLLWIGTGVGVLTALLAVSPVLATPGGGLPWASLLWIFGAVVLNGVVWTWFATRSACRGGLLAALRGE